MPPHTQIQYHTIISAYPETHIHNGLIQVDGFNTNYDLLIRGHPRSDSITTNYCCTCFTTGIIDFVPVLRAVRKRDCTYTWPFLSRHQNQMRAFASSTGWRIRAGLHGRPRRDFRPAARSAGCQHRRTLREPVSADGDDDSEEGCCGYFLVPLPRQTVSVILDVRDSPHDGIAAPPPRFTPKRTTCAHTMRSRIAGANARARPGRAAHQCSARYACGEERELDNGQETSTTVKTL